MSIASTILQTEKPYWIIVSDEGPSSFPHKHDTYQSAYDESIRLSKIKPGLKFNIFKYIGHAIATEPKVSFKTYTEYATWGTYQPIQWHRYNTKDDGIPF
jgi:hypothetical protein